MTKRGRPVGTRVRIPKIKHEQEFSIETVTLYFEVFGTINPHVINGHAYPIMSVSYPYPDMDYYINEYFTGNSKAPPVDRPNQGYHWRCENRFYVRENLIEMLKHSRLESFKQQAEGILQALEKEDVKDYPRGFKPLPEESDEEFYERLAMSEGKGPLPPRKGKRGPRPKYDRPEYYYKSIVPYKKVPGF